MLGKDFTIPGVTRHVFESFSQGQSFSRSAGLSADSHHLQPRKAVLDQLLRHSTSTIMLFTRTLPGLVALNLGVNRKYFLEDCLTKLSCSNMLGMARHKIGLTLLAGFTVLALGVYVTREWRERALIAYSVYRSHIFTLPNPAGSMWSRFWGDAQFYWDFSEIHITRERRLNELNPSLRPLVKEIQRHQAAGEGMQYSMHIYREIRWRLNFTPDVETTRARIAELRQSLSQSEQQELATQQQASDGSWGLGINVWYLKLYYSVEDGLDNGAIPRYPLAFLDRINSPEKLTAHLNSVLLDDFTKTGVFNREELDETFSALARLLLGPNESITHFIRDYRVRCGNLWRAGKIRRPDAGVSG
jgi:hypothetical protein